MQKTSSTPFKPTNPIRMVTATSLFDGHDASINIMRRIIQAFGCEVIHLGHDRSVEEIATCAIQEDAQGIALTSYQGGHMEYFKFLYDTLKERGAGHIKIFGGGGGVILPDEIRELQAYGIARIYSPDDGRELGLEGMIKDMLTQLDFSLVDLTPKNFALTSLESHRHTEIARAITLLENGKNTFLQNLESTAPLNTKNVKTAKTGPLVIGITGTGGAGKSSLVDEIIRRFGLDFPEKTLAIVSVDPSKRKTGGALLGDRIRMNAINTPNIYMRSMATRQSHLALSKDVGPVLDLLKRCGFDLIILETSGIGQSDTEVTEFADINLYTMTPEYGAATQLEKIDMLDFADAIAINKFDKKGAEDALRDVKKQYGRLHRQGNQHGPFDDKTNPYPVFGTHASQFNDPGVNALYLFLLQLLQQKGASFVATHAWSTEKKTYDLIIPAKKVRYLAEIAESNRDYDRWAKRQAEAAHNLYCLKRAGELLGEDSGSRSKSGSGSGSDSKKSKNIEAKSPLFLAQEKWRAQIDASCWQFLEGWEALKAKYAAPQFTYKVRDKEIHLPTSEKSLSGSRIPKVSLPSKIQDWGEILRFGLQENVPGQFPFTSGLFPFKRVGEDPTRMFAGEGGPERTNRRFHLVSSGMPAKRLSTAFDSVTLYGRDPALRPDIFGKIGNAGVSICCLDDAKKLYSGFRLTDPMTSVSMTINGPAPMLLAFFLNAAIDQECEVYIKKNWSEDKVRALKEKMPEAARYRGELPPGHNGLGLLLLGTSGDRVLPADVYAQIKAQTLQAVRGTIQADILKEDQAQNTCIFSTEFALKMMGDIQEYFIQNQVKNFYSVSVSGYHMAEAGANPITQLAFTLANGLTFVEYYLHRGMSIDDFAPNLSFFFSNGLDPEYAVIGRVARRLWAKAIKHKYGGNARSQMLKYHIQTSGRSLHAQEIDFNDIRTTLQALYAIYDNCNSLHTNAYDEAITTPTEESVRRAMAIQLIINKELGLAKNENSLQGSFIIEELTDLVEEAVLVEFERLSERGGVLGAMETMYQRGKIQEESLFYETLKHNGDFPIIGVNTFLSREGSPSILPKEVFRSSDEEKQKQIARVEDMHLRYQAESAAALKSLIAKAIHKGNIYEELIEACKTCTLGQITETLFTVGGQYRRNM